MQLETSEKIAWINVIRLKESATIVAQKDCVVEKTKWIILVLVTVALVVKTVINAFQTQVIIS